ncbi:MAG: 4-alpha-glucanotransferase [Ignavibacteriales bacterium]|nr:4-alpha-glucanotransferase [Ignavibacteriales bacterium]
MEMKRAAGALLHPTSLPGKYGVGDLGPEAKYFVDFLEVTGQTLWQMCPLGPTGYGDSPYQCLSAFAGNPTLVSPDYLRRDGFVEEADVVAQPIGDPSRADFERSARFKNDLLSVAFHNYKTATSKKIREEFEAFRERESFWLEDYALFRAVKEYHGGKHWREWKPEIALRDEGAVKPWRAKLAPEVEYYQFVQFVFFRQWNEIREYAAKKNVKIIGDAPIFVSDDSADVWANRELFDLDDAGKPLHVAGVPPDYFSETGQLWGNPLYRWNVMAKDDYRWWRERFRQLFNLFDYVRVDHFRGFEKYWSVPGDAKTAMKGEWVEGPGAKFFETIFQHFGDAPIIAEDLGVITDAVRELRDRFRLPGMKILQFAFGGKADNDYLPHNVVERSVIYTGTHDNDTTVGFLEKARRNEPSQFEHVLRYFNCSPENAASEMIRAAYRSVAAFAVVPMQDLLHLGSEARMNTPGAPQGNWTWRLTWDRVWENLSAEYRDMAMLYGRLPEPPEKKDDEKPAPDADASE